MERKQLTTAGEIIDALGGSRIVSRLCGNKSFTATNWRAGGLFPPETYAVLKRALAEKGYDAPDSLWQMREAAE